MSEDQRSVSTGTVIGIGFIVLGFLNLFASRFYHRTSINSHSRVPGLLFISVGIIIIIIRSIRKTRE